MKNTIKSFAIVVFSIFTFSTAIALEALVDVKPIDLVNNPTAYLNQEVAFSAKFDKFSTLGLDYKRAFRDSKDYISFLIKRPGLNEEYNIPLSELKLILKRDEAEKFIDIDSGDRIEIKGKVFSTALNDPWVDVYELVNLDPEKEEEKD